MTDFLVSPILENQDIKTTVKIQNIILPNIDICTVEELFLRLNSKVLLDYEQNYAELRKGGVITFDTYFNSFSVQKWKDYTNVKTININLHLKGVFKVRLLNIDYFSESPKLVNQKVITADRLDEVRVFDDIEIQPYKGLLYVEIEALENSCIFTGGYFYTNIINNQKLDVKIAAIICTYKRELYVQKNVQLLEKYLLSKLDAWDNFEIFIIDNGRSLGSFYNPKIHLIPNKNAGGSGGYTRGIIEVLKRNNYFSHIIFMDDDVVIAPEVFERIYNFQMLINDKDMCIGGSMLKLDSKYIQHENGAIWDKETVRLKPDIDLRLLKNVLFNEIEEHINYNGWWLFCFPTKLINDFTLPYPFFIKMDDMEMPIRLKQKIITLNGICVWHEPLENKYSPLINYYFRKNEIILNIIYFDSFSKLNAIKNIVKFSLREAFCYRYKSAELVLKAASDFLQGPEYLKSTNPEEKNLEVLKIGEKTVKNPDLPFVYRKYMESVSETESTISRWIRLITLNGHLLPDFFFYSNQKITGKGYRIAPLQDYRPVNVFRASKILYYNLINQEGFVASFSREEFFKIFINVILISWQMFFKFPTLRKLYRDTLPELTNRVFWEKYLEIDKYSDVAQSKDD
ncbi:MAG TPA: glycosyltransferase [Coleofasciculaceae cyanobacterium]|jgi:GT2 family glycosyltransferase